RMWTLQWQYGKLRAVGMMHIAAKRERLLLAIGCTQIFNEFERRRFAQIVVEAEGLEIIWVDPRNEPELHAPPYNLINERNFLCQTQRVVQRHDIPHRTDAYPACARSGPDDIKAG